MFKSLQLYAGGSPGFEKARASAKHLTKFLAKPKIFFRPQFILVRFKQKSNF